MKIITLIKKYKKGNLVIFLCIFYRIVDKKSIFFSCIPVPWMQHAIFKTGLITAFIYSLLIASISQNLKAITVI